MIYYMLVNENTTPGAVSNKAFDLYTHKKACVMDSKSNQKIYAIQFTDETKTLVAVALNAPQTESIGLTIHHTEHKLFGCTHHVTIDKNILRELTFTEMQDHTTDNQVKQKLLGLVFFNPSTQYAEIKKSFGWEFNPSQLITSAYNLTSVNSNHSLLANLWRKDCASTRCKTYHYIQDLIDHIEKICKRFPLNRDKMDSDLYENQAVSILQITIANLRHICDSLNIKSELHQNKNKHPSFKYDELIFNFINKQLGLGHTLKASVMRK